ncbi:MAG: hypothetical protein PHX34_02680 [Candidatus Shapirobacteria bacterium]|nr:hypothetical protein [Candidatus Shapirobacteria bacterium]
MNFREFLKKYKLIIFLVMLIFVLGFVKVYFGNKTDNISSEINTIEQKQINNKENDSNEKEPTPTEVEILSKEILKQYGQIKTEEEVDNFLKTLTDDQIKLLPEIDPDYSLEYLLPYEANTFIIEKYLDANILSVKTKGDDFDKSKDDLMEWLNKNAEDPENITIVWGKN